jgi:hypothetical protein
MESSNMPNLEALRQLRRVVEAAPDKLFRMRSVVEPTPCGTARCALGWCLVDPWFLANTPLGRFADWKSRYMRDDEGRGGPADVLYETFGLDRGDAGVLFGVTLTASFSAGAVAKAEVLANIDRVLAGERAVPYAATRR